MTEQQTVPTWKEFRQEWLRPGLWNENESAKQAKGQWGILSAAKKIAAYKYAAKWQEDARNSNSKDWNMLHCCRYLSQERWERYEEKREPTGPEMLIIKATDPGYNAWVEHMRMTHQNPLAYRNYIKGGKFYGRMRRPTPFPPQGDE